MDKLRKAAILPVMILLSALVSGCGGGSNTIAASNGSAPRRSGSLEYTLTTTKMTFARGEQVPLTFTVRNVSMQTVNVELGACDWFDTKVVNGSQVLWQQSFTHICGSTIQPLSIAPNETKTFSYSWPQTDQQGRQVPSGRYSLASWFQAINATDPALSPGNQEANEYAYPIQISVQ
jgi:hypothetical protein